jgi:TolA-binding protein
MTGYLIFFKEESMDDKSYEERIKIKNEMFAQIENLRIDICKCENKIEIFKNQSEELKNLEEHRKEFLDIEAEKTTLEKDVDILIQSYLRVGIPVPEEGEYEVDNGLIGMNRDINIKLTKKLEISEIREVFFIIVFNLLFFLKSYLEQV